MPTSSEGEMMPTATQTRLPRGGRFAVSTLVQRVAGGRRRGGNSPRQFLSGGVRVEGTGCVSRRTSNGYCKFFLQTGSNMCTDRN